MSNVGLWHDWNAGADPAPYSDSLTYELGAQFLESCSLVEDWGCGRGWMKQRVEALGCSYRGVDGSPSPFASIWADLVHYHSVVPGIFMRHVLEHNRDWPEILDNAVGSFTRRMALVLFTPLADETHEIGFNADIGVPDISFSVSDIVSRFRPKDHLLVDELRTKTQYGREAIFYAVREAA